MKRTPRPAIYIATFITALAVGLVFAQFDGTPSAPQNFVTHTESADWDIQVHSRDWQTWDNIDDMNAQHGADCSAPPVTHSVTAYEDMVFVCNNHVMTALNGKGYSLIYLTPNKMVDFSSGPAVIQWEQSTEFMSHRDWTDLWVTPWDDQLVHPLVWHKPDLNGEPCNSLHLDTDGSQRLLRMDQFINCVGYNESAPSASTETLHDGITSGTNQSATRQTFKLTISTTHFKFERLVSATAPAKVYMDEDFNNALTWTKGIVQFGHHSYSPEKDCGSNPCQPGTWHWDNVDISPKQDFTIIKAQQRVTTGGTVHFDAAAPVNSVLRFSAVGNVFVNGNFLAPMPNADGEPKAWGMFDNYMMPIAQGTTSVAFSFTNPGYACCRAKDMAIFSLTTGGATSTPTATSTATVPATSTPILPTATNTATPTEVPPTSTPTSTPVPPTSTPTATPTPLPPTPTPTPAPVGTCESWLYMNGQWTLLNNTAVIERWWKAPNGTYFLQSTTQIPDNGASTQAGCS
jgi:hypothetical protein